MHLFAHVPKGKGECTYAKEKGGEGKRCVALRAVADVDSRNGANAGVRRQP